MRNLIAVSISLYAVRFLLERKPIHYFIIVIIAMTFHMSACIMIPAYFYMNKDLSTKRLSFFILLSMFYLQIEPYLHLLSVMSLVPSLM